VQRIIKRYA